VRLPLAPCQRQRARGAPFNPPGGLRHARPTHRHRRRTRTHGNVRVVDRRAHVLQDRPAGRNRQRDARHAAARQARPHRPPLRRRARHGRRVEHASRRERRRPARRPHQRPRLARGRAARRLSGPQHRGVRVSRQRHADHRPRAARHDEARHRLAGRPRVRARRRRPRQPRGHRRATRRSRPLPTSRIRARNRPPRGPQPRRKCAYDPRGHRIPHGSGARPRQGHRGSDQRRVRVRRGRCPARRQGRDEADRGSRPCTVRA
jgi:hypothetical protein